MDSEKNLLKNELVNLEKSEEIEKFVEDAELLGHEDIAELGRQKLAEITKKAEEIKTTESQVAQVNELGGSNEALNEKTKEVDQEIEGVKTEMAEKIGEIENIPVDASDKQEANINVEDQKNLEQEKQKVEKIKELDIEINNLLEEIKSSLPNQINSLVSSEAYQKISRLNEKRKIEEQELFNIYNQYTQGHDSYRRSFSTHGLDYNGNQYKEDMKTAGASKEILKRFEDFVENYRKPELQAESDYSDVYREKINEARWDFEKTLTSKSEEVFGNDSSGSDEFKKKYYNLYRENFSKAINETIKDKPLHFNTVGKIYS